MTSEEDSFVTTIAPPRSRNQKWLRRTGCSLVATCTVVGCLMFLLFLNYRYQADRATNLIRAVRDLKVGESSPADVERVVARFRSDLVFPGSPCRAECAFTFRIDPVFWMRFMEHGAWFDSLAGHLLTWTDSPCFGRIGMRDFVVTATVKVAKGRVASNTVSLLVEGDCHKWVGAGWVVRPEIHDLSPHTDIHASSDNLAVHWSHLHMGFESGEVLTATMTPQATPEERAAALDINLVCLTSSSGCFFLSDLMPAAVRWQKSEGRWPLGWTSQTCPKHTNPD